MGDTQFYTYDADKTKPIDHIDFTVLSNEQILKMSALGKDTYGTESYELYDNSEPKVGGLIDPRMGVTDDNNSCATCGLNRTDCNGHFGHVTLFEPVFNIQYLQKVKQILSCICLKCSKLLVYKNEEEIDEMLRTKSGKARMVLIRDLVKNVQYCQKTNYGCGTPVSTIKLEYKKSSAMILLESEIDLTHLKSEDGGHGTERDTRKKVKQLLTPATVYDILKNISDRDCEIMGLDPKKCRPEDFIHQVFPIPPVQIRPSTRAEHLANAMMEDDLTRKLADVIKANQRIKKYKEQEGDSKATQYTADNVHLLQYHTATYMENDSITLPKSDQKGRETKSLNERFKGKEGRIRGNLMGNEARRVCE